MPFSLPSIPYPPSGPGFWDPVTSTLNWCEEDYYATIYSAEIINSLTNLTFVYLAFKGISNCIQNKHDIEFLIAFISYLLIGVGSILFHTSLKYSMQLLDELSMVYTTCIMFYALFSRGESKLNKALIFLFITSLAIFITGYYHYLKDPTFHQSVFSSLTAFVVFRSMYLMEVKLRPSRKAKRDASKGNVNNPDQVRKDERDVKILKTMWQLVVCGVGSIAVGYLIWVLDNEVCSTLRHWRREIGLPWGILLEGHGWWHIMTGFAAYYNLTWGIWLRYCLNGRQDDVELVWPSLYTSVPTVVRKDRLDMKIGYENGSKKTS